MVRCLCLLKIHNKILTLKVVVLGSGVFWEAFTALLMGLVSL
jgi:hypothetical protein